MAGKESDKKPDNKMAVHQAKKGLDKLFGGKARDSAEGKALRDAPDRKSRTEAAAAFVERWDYPSDLGTLTLFLRQRDAGLLAGALERMAVVADHAKPTERKLARSALNSAVLTMTERSARQAAQALLEQLAD